MAHPVIFIFNLLMDTYIFIVFITVILSWLTAFGVINAHNQFVGMILRMCDSLTAPVLRPIRNMLPAMNGLDLSPLVLLLGLQIIKYIGNYLLIPIFH